MMMDGMQGGGGWMLAHGIFWLLLIAGIVLLIGWLLQARSSASREQASESALEILEKRYARGEITRDEFERMKRDLS